MWSFSVGESPEASQDGHMTQSLTPMVLWFVPLHLLPSTMRPHFPLARPYGIAWCSAVCTRRVWLRALH
jgi:hypothetical protein